MLPTCQLAVHNFVHPPDQEVRKAFKSHDKGEILHKIVAEWNKGIRVQELPSATKRQKSLIKTLIHEWHNLWPSGSFAVKKRCKNFKPRYPIQHTFITRHSSFFSWSFWSVTVDFRHSAPNYRAPLIQNHPPPQPKSKNFGWEIPYLHCSLCYKISIGILNLYWFNIISSVLPSYKSQSTNTVICHNSWVTMLTK